jgi:hypothetical protein
LFPSEEEGNKMTELNPQQQYDLDASKGFLRIVDPRTKETYVLVKAEDFEKMRKVVNGFEERAG